MERHRALTPLITILAIATGLTLFATGWTLATPAVADPRPFVTEAVVRDFYAAVNLGISTGDTSALDNIVFEDAGFHGGSADIVPGRPGLSRYVMSLHATTPQLELTVVDVVSAGDRSLVDIAINGVANPGTFGSSASDIPRWGEVDALRVRDHKVVEYWSGANGLALFEPLGQAHFAETDASQPVALDRLTLLPGESFAAEGMNESRWFSVESGNATVSTSSLYPPYWRGVDEPDLDNVAIATGDFLNVPEWSRTEVQNDGPETASLLVMSAGPSTRGIPRQDPAYPQGQSTTYAGQQPPSWWPGDQERPNGEAMVASLTQNATATLPAGPWNISLARATLAPASALSVDTAHGLQLVTVNDGSIELSSVYHDLNERRAFLHMDAGEGTLIESETVARLSSAEQEAAVIIIIAILPAEA